LSGFDERSSPGYLETALLPADFHPMHYLSNTPIIHILEHRAFDGHRRLMLCLTQSATCDFKLGPSSMHSSWDNLTNILAGKDLVASQYFNAFAYFVDLHLSSNATLGVPPPPANDARVLVHTAAMTVVTCPTCDKIARAETVPSTSRNSPTGWSCNPERDQTPLG
jgi:hypothetical protein